MGISTSSLKGSTSLTVPATKDIHHVFVDFVEKLPSKLNCLWAAVVTVVCKQREHPVVPASSCHRLIFAGGEKRYQTSSVKTTLTNQEISSFHESNLITLEDI